MNTFALLLTAALLTGDLPFDGPTPQAAKRSAPTRLAHFDMSAYLTREGTKLNVNVDKQLGGQVDVQLIDRKGTVYFTQTLSATDTQARLRLDISDLDDGTYQLKVSNGLEMIVRAITISTPKPSQPSRSITVL